MRQVFLDRGTIVVKDVCRPLLDDHSVLVSVHYSFISSGIEVAAINNSRQSLFLSNIPKKIEKVLSSISAQGIESTTTLIKGKLKGELETLGYSCSGHVIAVGKKVKNFRTGDLIACAGAGFANHADIVCVPENLVVRIYKQEYLKSACLTTLGATAIQGLRRANVQIGECVCVWGLGLLGQLTVQLAKCAGCNVVGVDILQDRLDLALQCGADTVYNATDPDIVKDIVFCTGQYGVDATIITASSKSDIIIQQAIQVTRKKGKVIVTGEIGMNIDRNPLYTKEIDLLVSCSYGPGRYDQLYEQKSQDYPYPYVRWTENRNMQAFVDLLERGRLNLEPLTAAEAPLERIAFAYEQIIHKKNVGMVISFGPKKIEYHEQTPSTTNSTLQFVPARKGGMTSVGIVGAGNFSKLTLMPIIAKLCDVKINAIVDTDIARSLSASKLYGASKSLVDDNDLFIDNDLVDVVIVSSPHKFHSMQALRALRKGKAVFMEKPMVTDFEELNEFKALFKTNPNLPVCVDYNRSFASFTRKMKQAVEQRTSPLMLHYRVNAGYLPKDHWAQTEVGAGRIIGEVCHIIDLLCYLINSKPVSVSVESLHSSKDMLFPTDNFSAQIHFADGSIGTILYTSLGHFKMGKERIELFYDSKSIVMNDYIRMTGFGLPSSFTTSLPSADKGHETLLKSFFENVKKAPFVPPIAVDHLLNVAELTLLIDKLACEGGGSKELI